MTGCGRSQIDLVSSIKFLFLLFLLDNYYSHNTKRCQLFHLDNIIHAYLKTLGLAVHFKMPAKILLIFLHNFQWTDALSTQRQRSLPRNTRASAAL